MKLTHVVPMLALFGILALPGMVYGHCGHCGMGESKTEGKDSNAGHDHMAMMAKELGLSDDQQAKIKAIKDDMRKQKEALHQDTHAKINSVLTKEQQAKHAKMATSCEMCKHGKGEKAGAEHKH
jgi:hypothetical protein